MTDIDSGTPFDALGHEDRVRILEALVRHRADEPDDPALEFSELRRRVGVDDSGRFNYHLEKLTGQFVHETHDGYELSTAGRAVAGAILSGSFETGGEWGPTPLSAPCRECGGTVEATYEDGKIVVECEEGHLNHRDYFPRTIVERRSLPDAIGLAALLGQQDLELLLRGVCPRCNGSVQTNLESVEGTGVPAFSAACDRCGHALNGPPALAVLSHPVLRAFYLERGRDVRFEPPWTLPFLIDSERWRVVEADPLRVEIDASVGDDRLTFLLDDECTVREYDVEWP